jgi:hypothetical protein
MIASQRSKSEYSDLERFSRSGSFRAKPRSSLESCPGEILPNKNRIYLRRPTRHFHFSLAERRQTIHLLRSS